MTCPVRETKKPVPDAAAIIEPSSGDWIFGFFLSGLSASKVFAANNFSGFFNFKELLLPSESNNTADLLLKFSLTFCFFLFLPINSRDVPLLVLTVISNFS